MAQSFVINSQSPNGMEELMHLEEHDLPDLVALLQEHFDPPTKEQQQDLRDFEAGSIDFEALYSKYWNEDGSWKEDLGDLEKHLETLNLDEHSTNPKSDEHAVSDASEDLGAPGAVLEPFEEFDKMEVD